MLGHRKNTCLVDTKTDLNSVFLTYQIYGPTPKIAKSSVS